MPHFISPHCAESQSQCLNFLSFRKSTGWHQWQWDRGSIRDKDRWLARLWNGQRGGNKGNIASNANFLPFGVLCYFPYMKTSGLLSASDLKILLFNLINHNKEEDFNCFAFLSHFVNNWIPKSTQVKPFVKMVLSVLSHLVLFGQLHLMTKLK